jgi:hypothetical protein
MRGTGPTEVETVPIAHGACAKHVLPLAEGTLSQPHVVSEGGAATGEQPQDSWAGVVFKDRSPVDLFLSS